MAKQPTKKKNYTDAMSNEPHPDFTPDILEPPFGGHVSEDELPHPDFAPDIMEPSVATGEIVSRPGGE